MKYKPGEYWENRLKRELNLGVIGHIKLGLEYNEWLYKARVRALNKLIREQGISVNGKTVLDIGVGSGFYINFWKNKGAIQITGIDITETSVSTLSRKYPQYKFIKADIGSDLDLDEKFDIITAFDVLFHIVDENAFEKAIANIRMLCHDKSYILISDGFLSGMKKLSFHENYRTLSQYADILAKNNLKILAIYPIFYFMSSPIDSEAIRNRIFKILISDLWRINYKILSFGNKSPFEKLIGNVLGSMLYVCDGFILYFIHPKASPCMKLLLARPASATEKSNHGDRSLENHSF